MVRALQLVLELLSRKWLILAFPLYSFVLACSQIPKQEQAVLLKRPIDAHSASSILEKFAAVIPESKVFYADAYEQLNPNEFSEINKLLADVYERKETIEKRANVALIGLKLSLALVPVRSSSATRYWQLLRNIREIAIFYGPELLNKLNNTSPSYERLNGVSAFSLEANTNNVERLERLIETLLFAARGAGVSLGQAAVITESQRDIALQIESKIKPLSSEIFAEILPRAREITNQIAQDKPISQQTLEKTVLNITLQALSMATVIKNGMQNGQIENDKYEQVVDEWANRVIETVKESSTDVVASATSVSQIPEVIPSLDPQEGSFSGELGTWQYVADVLPKSGSLDLSQNPPKYSPSKDFGDYDQYTFKLCHSFYTTICSRPHSKVIHRPSLKDFVYLESTGRGFLPNSQVTCRVGPNENRTLIYSWYRKPASNPSQTIRLDTETSKTLANIAYPRGDEFWCEVQTSDVYGLFSQPIPSASLSVPNSWPKITKPVPTNATVFEDSTTTILMGELSDENGDPLRWIVVSPPGKGAITNSGVTYNSPAVGTLQYALRANESGTDVLTYKVCDNQIPNGCTELLTLNINIVPQPDTPKAISLAGREINENMSANTPIGTFETTDEDISDSFTYTLSGEHASYFNVLGNTLRSSQSFDYESLNRLNITVTSTDSFGLSASKNVEITVNNINEPPTNISLSSTTINENNASGDLVATIGGSDLEGGPLIFSIKSGVGDHTAFYIEGDKLRANQSFNFEDAHGPNYVISLIAQDSAGLQFEKNFTIGVNDINDPPTNVGLSNQIVNENNPSNSVIGEFSTTDADASDTGFLYTLVNQCSGMNTGNSFFNISGSNLRATSTFNFENQSSYQICVRSTDNSNTSIEKAFTITVNNQNDSPTLNILSSVQLTQEDTAKTVPFNLGDEDGHLACSSAHLSYTSGDSDLVAAANAVEWSGTWPSCIGTITPVANAFGTANVTFSISDGSLTSSQTFTFSVSPLNDVPTISDTPDQTTIEDVAINSIPVSITDAEPGLSCFSITAQSSNLSLLPSNRITFSGSAPSCFMNISPSPHQYGSSNITLTVSDTVNSSQDTFSLLVASANDTPTNLNLIGNTIIENSGANTTIGSLQTEEIDVGDSHTYSLVAACGGLNGGNSIFNISGNILRNSLPLDFENQSSYNVCIRTTDTGGLSFDKSFIVNVIDQNDPPTNILLSSNGIPENSSLSTIVGELSTADVDTGDSVSYSLVSGCSGGDTGNPDFTISGTQLRSNSSFNFETQNLYNICVRSIDTAGAFFEKAFTIAVTDVNETPSDIYLSGYSLAENSSSNTLIGVISTADVDFGDTASYSLVSGCSGNDTGNSAFNISGTQLRSNTPLNFESQNTYNICIRTTDSGGSFYDKSFAIAVTNVNEVPHDITLSANTISENNTTNALIGALNTADVDSGDTATYTLVAGCGGGDSGNSSFVVSGTQLRSNAAFDFEIQNSYSVCLRTTDAAGAFFEKAFNIAIGDINETPTDISLSVQSIPENSSANSLVGSLTTADFDLVDTATYTLVSGCSGANAGNSAFNISGTQLRANSPFNFETQNSFTICIRTTDTAGAFYEKSFTISVTDVNEVPQDFTLNANVIAENSPVNTDIGTFSTSDVDAGDTATYSLVSGCSGADSGNSAFNIYGSVLRSSGLFNFETQNVYSICLRTTDVGGLFIEKSFLVGVTNVNEAPISISLSSNTISENAPLNTIIGSLSATDVDIPDSATFSLVTDCSGIHSGNSAFNISGASLRSNSSFNFEAQSSYSICVRSTDVAGLSYNQPLTINITNVNEGPSNINLSSTSIAENNVSNAVVGMLSTADVDAVDTANYTLVSGCGGSDSGNSAFNILGASLRATSPLDFENTSSYSVCIRTTDGAGAYFEKAFTISVTNVNEGPTDISLSNGNVSENSSSNTIIGTLSSTDVDIGDLAAYSLVSECSGVHSDNSYFNISGTLLRASSTFNFESQNSFSICVRITDAAGLFYDEAFTISVNNVNETPTDIFLNANSVAENSASDTVVGYLSTADIDAGDTATYTLVNGCSGNNSGNSSFNISGTQLRASTPLNFELQSFYAICLRTTDAGNATFDKTFTITVTNVNETPTEISLSANSIAENAGSNAIVGTLSTTDVDAGDTATYSLVSGCSGVNSGNSAFNILGTTLRATNSFNFETISSYSICVRTTDAATTTFEKVFTVTVTNVNETPTDLSLSVNTIAENAGVNTIVGTFSTVDVDAGSSATYSLEDGCSGNYSGNSFFNISTSDLRANNSFNYESQSSYDICVRATDAPGSYREEAFTVYITNVNETPTDISLSVNSIAENAGSNAIVGTLSTTDVDAGDTATYSLISGCSGVHSGNAAFNILGTTLRATTSLNFETNPSYDICVRTIDAANTSFEKVFTVTVTNVNEPPADLSLSVNTIAENAGENAIVGTFSTVDVDAGSSATYSLENGCSGNYSGNAYFNISGSDLRENNSFNYEIQSSYDICVRTTDAPGSYREEVFTVNVTNVNETPTDISLSANSIAENAGPNAIVGTLSTTDVDTGDTATYSLVSGCSGVHSGNSAFNILGTTLRATTSLNFETNPSYNICVRTTDAANTSFEKVFTVTVTNVNEPPTDLSLSVNTIAENAGENAIVGAFSTVDVDAGSSATYSLENGCSGNYSGNAYFNISGSDLRENNSFNYESQSSYDICVRTTDAPGSYREEAFTVYVTNVNETPTDISLSVNSIAENAGSNAIVGTLSTTDVDTGDTATHSLVSGCSGVNSGNSAFNILGTTLRATTSLNFETNPSYNICVRTTDAANTSFEKVFTINVTNINEAPTDLSLSVNTIAENAGENAIVGTFSTVDVDAGSSATYSLEDGCSGNYSGNAFFNISGADLRANDSFNYESQSSYDICVRTTDAPGSYREEVFTVNVTNVNETPTDISLSANSITENAGPNAIIGTLSTTDVDTGDTATYSLVSGCSGVNSGNSAFNILGATLRATTSLNFETNPSYNICVRATDAANTSFEKVFTVTVTNVNEAPTDLSLSVNTIAENAGENAIVGTFSTVDVDAGSSATYSLENGCGGNYSGNAYFNISGSDLRENNSFNYESQSSYDICVRTTDAPGSYREEAFTVYITNVNETPTDISLSANSIAENAVSNAIVGTLSTTDVDTGDTATYSLVSGCSGVNSGNSAFNILGTTLRATTSLNFETNPSYDICVRTTDAANSSFEKVFTVNVTNVNEAPTDLSLSVNTIAENAGENAIVGTFSTVDVDAGSSATYSLEDGCSGNYSGNSFFNISISNLRANDSFNHEIQSSYDICVRTTDALGLYREEVFTVNVTNVNETPTDISLSANSIAENASPNATVGTLSTTDVDAGDTATYSLSSGCSGVNSGNSAFNILGATLRATTGLNFETNPSYNICVRTTDAANNNFDKVFTVTVTNVNEAPTDLSLSVNTIAENAGVNAIVGTLSTADVDSGDNATYSLVSECTGVHAGNSAFNIFGTQLRANNSFNFEVQNSYSICLRTTDTTGASFNKSFIINVTDANDTPIDITLSANTIPEISADNFEIGNFSTFDVDAGDTATYELASGCGGGDSGNTAFNISGTTLRATAALNFETHPSFSICVRTTDTAGAELLKNFTVVVTNVNEPPTNISLPTNYIAENAGPNAVVGSLSTTDVDAGDTAAYSLFSGCSGVNSGNSAFNIDGTNLRANSSFNFESQSTYNICVRTSDAAGLFYDKSFAISVTNVNEPPSTTGGDSTVTTNEDTLLSVTLAQASDPDASDTFSYLIVSSPAHGSLGSPSAAPTTSTGATISYTPTLNYAGSDSFTYSICDQANVCSPIRTVSITVLEQNDPPQISALSNQTINEDTPTSALTFSVSDVDDSVTCSMVTRSSSHTDLIANVDISISGESGTTCSLVATPTLNRNDTTHSGPATITLTLPDGDGATATRTFNISVSPVNDPPTMNAISAQSVNMDTVKVINFEVGDIDGALDCSSSFLSYSSSTSTIVAASGAVTFGGTWPNCTGSVTPATNAFGLVNLTFQITDNGTLTASQTFTLTVNDTRPASAPVLSGSATVISNQSQLTLSGTCVSGYDLSLSGDVDASEVSAPPASLNQTCPSNGNFSYTVNKPNDGQFIFRVSQQNPLNLGWSSYASKIWTRDTVVPASIIINEPLQNPTTSRSGSFSLRGTCESGTMLNVSATVIPNTISVSPTSIACSALGTFTVSQSLGTDGDTATDGTYDFSLIQTDTAGNSSPQASFRWTKDSNIPATPVLSSPTPITNGFFYTNASTSTTYPYITVSCSSSNLVAINENGNEISSGNCSSGTYSFQVPAHVDGTYQYSIHQVNTATDQSSAVEQFTWKRDTLVPTAPVFTNPSTTAITTPSPLYISGNCESGSTLKIYVDGVQDSSLQCISGRFEGSVVRGGVDVVTYSVTATQQDQSGNTSASSSSLSWTKDPDSVPIPTITFPTAGSAVNNSNIVNIVGLCQPNFTISISGASGTSLPDADVTTPENGLTQTCTTDGAFSFTVTKSTDASYNFNITQTNPSGPTNSVPAAVTWTRDTTPPTVTITPSVGNNYSANASFSLSANESVTSFSCSNDGLNYSTCTTSHHVSLASSTAPTTAHGVSRTLYVKATDTAQNTSSPSQVTWTPTVYATSLLYRFTNETTVNSSSYNALVSSTLSSTGSTYHNSTPYSQGGTGRSFAFGNSNDFGELTDNAVLSSFLSTATIEFFMFANNSTSWNILSQEVSTTSGFSWSIKTAKINNSTFNISFLGSVDGSTKVTTTSTCAISELSWHHVAVTFDKGAVKIFCDGVLRGTGVVGTSGSARLFDSTGPLIFGKGLDGRLDEVRISQGIRYSSNFTPPTSDFTVD